MKKFTLGSKIDSNHLEKLGNLIIYLSSKIPDLYLTKLLKLIYIIDETAMKRTGIIVSWLKYRAWVMGPVPDDLYSIIRGHANNPDMLLDFINIEDIKINNIDCFKITSKTNFDDSDFSEFEIELMDEVIENYGKLSSDELIKILHDEKSQWDKVVTKFKIKNDFNNNPRTTSPYPIPLHELNEGDPYKEQYYKEVSFSFQL